MSQARSSRPGSIEPREVTDPPSPKRHTTFARVVGALGLVLLTSLLFWMLTDDAFTVTDAGVTFEGLAHADEDAVRERLADLERGPNVFRVEASRIVGELSTLTEVDAAAARVQLPAAITVALDERDPVFIWSNGALSWLVDEDGMLFAPADEATAATVRAAAADRSQAGSDDPAPDSETVSADEAAAAPAGDAELTLVARANLPKVEDARLLDEPPTVGAYLKPTDLLVMRQLLALTPELLGSQARSLELRVDDSDGYVLRSDRGWRALFGHYTPTLQPPSVLPRQVQCLQWLLANEERKLKEAWLALSDEGCGTFSRIR